MALTFGYLLLQTISEPQIWILKFRGKDFTMDLPVNANAYNEEKMYNQFITPFLTFGTLVSIQIIPETIIHALAQNWVKMILCVVGLILVLVGIGLIIAGIIKLVRNGKKLRKANKVTIRNQEDSKNFEGFISLKNTNILQNKNISNTNPTKVN